MTTRDRLAQWRDTAQLEAQEILTHARNQGRHTLNPDEQHAYNVAMTRMRGLSAELLKHP